MAPEGARYRSAYQELPGIYGSTLKRENIIDRNSSPTVEIPSVGIERFIRVTLPLP